MPRELDAIVDALAIGRQVEPVTVRTFLGWFGAYRRGWRVVSDIRGELSRLNVDTIPDFESRWIDATIQFELRPKTKARRLKENTPSHSGEAVFEGLKVVQDPPIDELSATWVNKDATYRISKLAAANSGVERVPPDASLSQAVTLMLARDFSQLPVMTTERDIKGIISWQSVGSRLALGCNAKFVRGYMEQAYEIGADASIFEAITVIVQLGYVLVRGDNNAITGIVTASDLSVQFRTLTEPFLLLSEIENLVRNMIGDHYPCSQLAEACDPGSQDRSIRSVSDLSFGEYIRLLENPDRWGQLNVDIERDLFCKELDRVRNIRNDVMHFDPDGITPDNLSELRVFAQFLKKLEQLRVAQDTFEGH